MTQRLYTPRPAQVETGNGDVPVTDHDGLWGSMEFAHACKGLGLRAITGAELTIADERDRFSHLTLLVQDRAGYRNLCRLITAAHARTRESGGTPGAAQISLDRL